MYAIKYVLYIMYLLLYIIVNLYIEELIFILIFKTRVYWTICKFFILLLSKIYGEEEWL